MIVPKLAGDKLLQDIREAAGAAADLHIWWLGQSGFLVQHREHHLLIDPYLSDSLTEKYAQTDKLHVRMTELPIRPEQLDFIDVVTSSHGHTDHLDGETLVPLLEANPAIDIIVPEANCQLASERLRVPIGRLTPIDDGQSIVSSGFSIHAVPSAHETVERDDNGCCRFLGYVIECGKWVLYHSGDTMLYDDLVDRLSSWPIDVAILPINGRSPERGVAGNLSGHEAAQLAKDISARLVIPCHYDMFEFNTATPEELVATARDLEQPYRILECGERWSSQELDALQTESTAISRMEGAVCVQVYPTRVEAEYAATRLEANGVHAMVEADDGGYAYPGFALTSAAGARLMVIEHDLDKAREILASD